MNAPDPLAADRHLDLGCGTLPRNPYGRRQLYGVDLRAIDTGGRFECAVANLAMEPIPFATSMFGSVSAFNFIEHVPRVLNGEAPGTTRFPFIELMTEVWRVLAPGGLFYALTPCYPHPAAFQDPTHVNIISDRTHEYFCGAEPLGRMYGFRGRFDVRCARWVIPEHSEVAGPLPLKHAISRWRKERRGKLAFFLWELAAVKAVGADVPR